MHRIVATGLASLCSWIGAMTAWIEADKGIAMIAGVAAVGASLVALKVGLKTLQLRELEIQEKVELLRKADRKAMYEMSVQCELALQKGHSCPLYHHHSSPSETPTERE